MMKKTLIGTVLMLLLMLSAVLSYADDALMIPAGVLRISPGAGFGFTVAEYDDSWKRVEIPKEGGRLYEIAVGTSIGLGLTDWLTAVIEWTPGFNVWSTFDYPAGTDHPDYPDPPITDLENAKIIGPYVIYTTVKFQLVGRDAPIKFDPLRLVLAPVVKIPLPQPDWQKQADRMSDGDNYIYRMADKHSFGAGARAYVDLILTKSFYVNLFGEFLLNFNAQFDDTALWGPVAGTSGSINYGGVQTAELEPHFETEVGGTLKLGIGLPVRYSVVGEDTMETGGGDWVEFYRKKLLSISPNVCLSFPEARVPVQMELAYKLPLIGSNVPARHTLSLLVSTDLKLF